MKLALRYLFLGSIILIGVAIFAYFQSKREVNVTIQENDPVFSQPAISPEVYKTDCEKC